MAAIIKRTEATPSAFRYETEERPRMMGILKMFDAITRTEATPSAFRYEKEEEAEND